MKTGTLTPVPVCDDSRCRKPVDWLIYNDLQIPKMRYCDKHAQAWSSTNKRRDWTMGEYHHAEQTRETVLRSADSSSRELNKRDDTRPDTAETRDWLGPAYSGDRGGGEDNTRALSGRLEPAAPAVGSARDISTEHDRPIGPDSPSPFGGAGQLELTEQQARLLMAPVDAAWVDIRPDGLLYLPQIHYRRILNATFRPGGWAMVPVSKPIVMDNRMTVHYYMYAGGRFVGEAVGSMAYYAKSAGAKWDDCVEGAKSDALTRICKDLGIASELWDWRYGQEWKKEFACLVNVNARQGSKQQWRRIDKDPFPGEQKPGRAGQGAYYKAATMEDEFNEHFDAITNE